MKIAIITTKLPSLRSGGPIRDYYLMDSLIKNSENVVKILCISQKNEDEEIKFLKSKYKVQIFHYRNVPNTILFRIIDYFKGNAPQIEHLKRNSKQNILLNNIGDVDIVIFNELDAFFSCFQIYDKISALKVLNAHNVDHLKYKADVENKSFIHKILVERVICRFEKDEINAAKKFNHIIVCSRVDLDFYSKHIKSENISFIPNGVDHSRHNVVSTTDSKKVMFVGLLSYGPNMEAVNYYLSKVHRYVVRSVSDYKFYIIGSGYSTSFLNRCKLDNKVVVCGYVNNLAEYLRSAQVCVCPVINGSGTRLKILEYMAAGRSVVSTSKGAEGLEVTNGLNIFIEDDPVKFGKKVIELLKNVYLCRSIGKNARELVESKYSWSDISKQFERLCKNLIDSKSS